MALILTIFHFIAMGTAAMHLAFNGLSLPAAMWFIWAFISWIGWLEAVREGK